MSTGTHVVRASAFAGLVLIAVGSSGCQSKPTPAGDGSKSRTTQQDLNKAPKLPDFVILAEYSVSFLANAKAENGDVGVVTATGPFLAPPYALSLAPTPR